MMAEAGSERRGPSAIPCPICGKPAAESVTPFCSQRCADVDLGRWLGERYVIPGPEAEPGEEREDDGSHRAP